MSVLAGSQGQRSIHATSY